MADVKSSMDRMRDRLAALRDRVEEQLAEAGRQLGKQVRSSVTTPAGGWRAALQRRRGQKARLFDARWIERQRPELGSITFRRYVVDPELHGLHPHPLFDASRYLELYPDVREAGVAPLQHFLEFGWREGRSPHLLFSADWYLQSNPDVAGAGLNPLEHYLEHGWKEGRWPNPVFDPVAYLDRYPDVRAAGIEPLTHYVMYGHDEKRDPIRGFGKEWMDVAGRGHGDCLLSYLLGGASAPNAERPEAQRTSSVRQNSALARLSDGSLCTPAPLADFALTQRMRDVVVEGYGEEQVDLVRYLCSLMAAYADRPAEFANSVDCHRIMEWLGTRSAELVREHAGSAPAASVIIPVYNNAIDTLLCLTSIFGGKEKNSFEIIVADDCSTDATISLVPSIGGVVRHLQQTRNLGFVENCNAAAEQACGETVVLLNNDTLPLPGWLDGLLAPFGLFDDIGLVGSKLLNWDGSLQEAGGIFWKDGSAWNFGRGADPREPQFNYAKDVDYCSGAAIAVPLAVWRSMGGFDRAFAPAYCEDADLAFRLRKAGYRTLYNPASEVIHHEGRSHGRDLNSGIKAYQVANQKKFVRRWEATLDEEHFPNAQQVLVARDRSRDRPHILVIDHHVPQWDRDAGSRTIEQYLRILIELGFQVTFWPDNLYLDPIYSPALQSLGIEIIYGVEFRGQFERFMRERKDLYDAVFISRPQIAANYLATVRDYSKAKVLFYGHDLHFRRMEAARTAGMPIEPAEIEQTKKTELEVCRACDVIFYPDPEEIAIVSKAARGGKRKFIANPVFVYDSEQIAAGQQRVASIQANKGKRLLFVGSFAHTPNHEGVIWFVNDVLPKVWAKIPDAVLDVVGANPPADVTNLGSDRVLILGRVSDDELDRLYADAAVVVAPLRFGAGVKGKVIEALAFGVPVATTPIGAQGIASPDKCLFLGKTADELAKAVVQALTNRDESAKRAANGLEFIRRNYSRKHLVEQFRELFLPRQRATQRSV